MQQKITTTLILCFVAIHLVLPFRYLVYTNHPEWTGIGSRFAWRMKMQTQKIDQFTMSLADRTTGATQDIDYSSFLSANQLKNMTNNPFSIIQFAKYLHGEAEKKGMIDPIIKTKLKVQFNGRSSQFMINPDTDLSRVDENNFNDYSWIMPLKELKD